MEKIKLFELLETFAPKEFENFGYYLSSPLHNNSENAIKLYRLISKHYPDFSSTQVSKEIIHKKIYPKEEFKDKKIRDLFSGVLTLAEDFLAIMKFKNTPILSNQFSLTELGKKKLTKHFSQKCKEIETIINNKEYRDSEYFFSRFEYLREKRYYFETKEYGGNRKEFHDDVNKEVDQLILYFLRNMLYYYVHLKNYELTLKYTSHFEMFDELIAYLEKRNLENYPELLVLYYTVILDRDPEKVEIFYKLRDLMTDSNKKIEKELCSATYIKLYNYSKIRSLYGDVNFKKVNFEIIKETLQREMYPMVDGYLPIDAYLLIVAEGLTNKEFEWTKEFINKYKAMVQPDKRENAYDYSMASYYYRIKKYDESLKLLAKVKCDDYNYTLKVKFSLLKIYFETGQYEAARNIVDTSRHYLNSNKLIPEYDGSRYIKLVSFMGRIINSVLNNDFDNLRHLRKEIFESSHVENRTWMLEQLDEIIP